MTRRSVMLVFEKGGHPGRIEFFRRDAGGYAIRFDAPDARGNPSMFNGCRISDEDMTELVRLHAEHTAAKIRQTHAEAERQSALLRLHVAASISRHPGD